MGSRGRLCLHIRQQGIQRLEPLRVRLLLLDVRLADREIRLDAALGSASSSESWSVSGETVPIVTLP